MWVRRAAAMMVLVGTMVLASVGCRGVFRQYEYEEEIYLKLDGSADVVVNTSIPALVALHGADLSTDPSVSIDRDKLRAFYQSPTTQVTRVSRPWRRFGRRFIQVRVATSDVRSLGRAAPFAWSVYRMDRRAGLYVYRQTLGAPMGKPVGNVGWNGSELVAVRMHVPSKIPYHNAPSRQVERGNILGWEQPLSDRLAGKPIEIEVRMETASILARTLLIFALSAAAALTLLAAIVFWVRRAGRTAPAGAR
jgi:hypothetical protein